MRALLASDGQCHAQLMGAVACQEVTMGAARAQAVGSVTGKPVKTGGGSF